MTNPYRIPGPALISFSGGRTSAFMLHEIIRAYDGVLPDDVVVAFANTGKEREETLRFVHECGTRWNVPIRWIEWRPTAEEVVRALDNNARPEVVAWLEENLNDRGFVEVSHNDADRVGVVFSGLIAVRGFVPNGQVRFCSPQLKIRPIGQFVRHSYGWETWSSVIGLRHDEGHRCLKAYERNAQKRDRFKAVLPLDKARVTERDVLAFWHGETMHRANGDRPHGFDLELYSYEGNCDLCFLKRRAKLTQLIRDDPSMAQWWINEERTCAAKSVEARQFRKNETYTSLLGEVMDQPVLPIFDDQSEEHDVECGLICAGEAL